LTTFLVVTLKTQTANAANYYRQNKTNTAAMVTFLFSVHTIIEAKQ